MYKRILFPLNKTFLAGNILRRMLTRSRSYHGGRRGVAGKCLKQFLFDTDSLLKKFWELTLSEVEFPSWILIQFLARDGSSTRRLATPKWCKVWFLKSLMNPLTWCMLGKQSVFAYTLPSKHHLKASGGEKISKQERKKSSTATSPWRSVSHKY